MNDPFELKPHIDALTRANFFPELIKTALPEHVAKEYGRLPPEVREQLSEVQLRAYLEPLIPYATAQWDQIMAWVLPQAPLVFESQFEKLGILCLTESPDSLLMWAHYADSHRGFVVEFDSESAFFHQQVGPDDDFRHVRRMIYRHERPSIVLTEVHDFSPFFTKGIDWEYEAEWRMMMPVADANMTGEEGPNAVHLFEFPRSIVRRVILGCRMLDSKMNEIRSILRENSAYAHVSCVQARTDDRNYRLLIPDEVESTAVEG